MGDAVSLKLILYYAHSEPSLILLLLIFNDIAKLILGATKRGSKTSANLYLLHPGNTGQKESQ